MKHIHFASINDIRNSLKKKEINIKEIYSETIKLFDLYDKSLNSSIEYFKDIDLSVIEQYSNNQLYGIPYFVKDVICQKNRGITASSKILSNCISPYDATVIKKLNQSGAFSVGRGNCDEFGMGSSGETSFYGPAHNPWNLLKVPGGSSSGSAVAVAAGLVPFSLGAETGGSVRQPACLCGIVGLKPTYGAISRYGVIAYASSIDQVGIFARNIDDTAEVFSIMIGLDEKDSTSQSFDFSNYKNKLNNPLIKGKKIAVINNAMNANGINVSVKQKLEDALKVLESLGAIIEYIELPIMELAAAVYFIVSRAEAASNLSRFDGIKYGHRSENSEDLNSLYCNSRFEGFGEVVRSRIILGNYVLSSGYADQYYIKAKMVQAQMKKEFFEKLENYDALFSPVSPTTAFNIGDNEKDSLFIDLQDYFTSCANLTHIPSLAIPCGFIDGMPTGFQLFGKMFDEINLFEIGKAYENATDWHNKHPQDFMKNIKIQNNFNSMDSVL